MTRLLVAAAIVFVVLGAIGAVAWSPYFAALFMAGAALAVVAAR